MKTDSEIQKDVQEELKWEARTKGTEVKMAVKNGRVILSGNVDSYVKKIDSEKVVMKVAGVRYVSNELVVKIPEANQRADKEIEKAVLNAVKWNAAIDENKIKVQAEEGWVTIEGEVEWAYQRSRARTLAEDIIGVTGITNLIEVTTSFGSSPEVKEKIVEALKRNYYFNINNIMVGVDGSKAILNGTVHTLAEKSAAEAAAWSAPGITQVENNLEVTFDEVFV